MSIIITRDPGTDYEEVTLVSTAGEALSAVWQLFDDQVPDGAAVMIRRADYLDENKGFTSAPEKHMIQGYPARRYGHLSVIDGLK